MANLFELPRYIAVEGPMRVGKSTLARILAERLNAQRVMEPEENPFLPSFYEGERGAAFQAQFTFLMRRFEQLQALDLGPQSQRTVVADFISPMRNSIPTIGSTTTSVNSCPHPTW